jgi:hypothetical protein
VRLSSGLGQESICVPEQGPWEEGDDLADRSRAPSAGYIRSAEKQMAMLEERSAMPGEDNDRTSGGFHGPQYARIDSELTAEIRREVFGEDIGRLARDRRR